MYIKTFLTVSPLSLLPREMWPLNPTVKLTRVKAHFQMYLGGSQSGDPGCYMDLAPTPTVPTVLSSSQELSSSDPPHPLAVFVLEPGGHGLNAQN